MADEVLTISKHDLIDILTKSGIFNAGGIEVVLSRDGLKGVLSGMMVTIDNSRSRADHYKDECSRLKEIVRVKEFLDDKYKDMSKSEVDRSVNMRKVYTIESITYNLFDVILYENGIEVDGHTVYPENLDRLIKKIEDDGYIYVDNKCSSLLNM